MTALRDLCQALGFKITLRTNPSAQVRGSPKLVVFGRKDPSTLEFSFLGFSILQAGSTSISLASDFLLYAWVSHFLALGTLIFKTETEEVPRAP